MNNLQITKLKFTKKSPAQIEFNHEEIKAFLNDALADYTNEVVTEESVKDAKKTRADLNKLSKELDDNRKKVKKELSQPISEFESNMKELKGQVDSASEHINEQVKFFEDKVKEEKRIVAFNLIDQTSYEIELWPKYRNQVELKEEYTNLTASANKVKADIVEQFKALKMLQDAEQQKIDTIKIIVETYNDQLEFKFDSQEFDYLLDYDVNHISNVVKQKVLGRIEQEKETRERLEREKQEAIEKAQREAEERVRREEEAKRLEEEKRHQEQIRQAEFKADSERRQAETNQKVMLQDITQQIENIVPVEEVEETPIVEYSFSVKGTINQIETLKRYMEQYGMEFEELF